MNRPSVSAIVTSFNYGRYVAAALESVRSQTYGDFECLVVDDGSTDNSIALIEPFLDDPRFRLIQLENGGVSRARNAGLAAAQGRFVAFLDADDLWQPTKLERQLARFDVDPAYGVVFTRRTIIDGDGQSRQCANPKPPEGDVVGPLFRQNFVCFSSAMMTTEAADRVGGFDEGLRLAVDYEFWLRVAGHYRFGLVDEPLVAYRVGHGTNLSSRQRERYHVALFVMQRFQREFDTASRLTRSNIAGAQAETFVNLGVLSRGGSSKLSASWLLCALRTDPLCRRAWRNILSTLMPAMLRRFVRRIRGQSGDWEKQLYSRANRREAVL
jgi:GT2 family glycosyltransferase